MRPRPVLLLFIVLCLSVVHGQGSAALVQLTGTTPVLIDDERYAGDSVSVYQSAPITLQPGAEIGGFLIGYQFARLDILGGQIGAFLHAYTQSDVLLSGGSIAGDIIASGIAAIDIFGGTAGGELLAEDDAIIRIHGGHFQVDGAPVPLGGLFETSGLLTGTLDSGEPLSNLFRQGELELGAVYTGAIVLIPEPAKGLLSLSGLGTLAASSRCSRRARARASG